MNDTTALLPDIKLRFNIEHPSYEDSYALGYQSAMAYSPEEENPFRDGSQAAADWLEGWWDATSGAEPLFDLSPWNESEALVVEEIAANDKQYSAKTSLLTLVIEVSGALAASALVGYQLFEMVA